MMFEGKVWRFGDNVDTDVIIPARYLNTADPAELAKHCMEDIDTEFARDVQVGQVIVAGRNFGCGSSREHAPAAIKACGISCVIAHSFARIFYRNAVNIGLPLIELGDISETIRHSDVLVIDTQKGEIRNRTTGASYSIQPLPEFIQEIARAGGLIEYVKGCADEKDCSYQR